MKCFSLSWPCSLLFGGVRVRYCKPYIRWSSTQARQWSTPLARQISEAINTTGPISIAAYMRMCLTSDQGGYYKSDLEGRDQFGTRGDFITSPEISQIFGELIGIWFVAEWMSQGMSRKSIELVEIGPGRGTLMDDILRTIRNFRNMMTKIEAIHLIETSASLRLAQKNLLCGDNTMEKTPVGYRSISKYINIPIFWTENIHSIPSVDERIPFIVAHEFFDSLPIHAFQSVLSSDIVQQNIKPSAEKHRDLKEINKRQHNQGIQWREMVVTNNRESTRSNSEFQLALSDKSTPHSLYLPETSPRYKALKKVPGSLLEISPESVSYAQEIGRLIGGSKSKKKTIPSGAAIIIDYGPSDTVPINSLRGISGHKLVSPFSSPGLVDLSADVDFVTLSEAALAASSEVEVYGPIEQGPFLLAMGIRERAEMLLKNINNDEEKRNRVESSWKRLVDQGRSGMGKVYKVMTIVPRSGGRRKPIGFGGELQ